ncbi:sugar-binding transcriptional regulator [Pseudarthrobacter sp. N5]|uniref:sugar-binding transcriptional regulator n=1 Tax=Pseudarthrobacter sp. N5 TaxID=3418416 RepID=UPI003CF0FE22
MSETSHEELLARIGKEYYLDNRSKVEIATSHGISRFQVARYLDEARAAGIVKIEVHFPNSPVSTDASQLAALLGVRRVVVVRSLADVVQQRDELGQAAAKELMATARAGMTVGISWSRTLDVAADHVTELPSCEVVQLAGALPVAGNGNPLELIQRLGRVSGGRTWPMWAPLVVDSAATANGLRRQPEISDALNKADSLDLAVVAIGGWAPEISTVWERVDNPVRKAALAAGAVAECSGRLIDANGSAVTTELDARIIAVTLAQLQSTPQVIAVAQGAGRADAVRASAAAGFISALILDEELAAVLAAGLPAEDTA